MSHTLKLDSHSTEIHAPVGRIVDESGHNSQDPSPESMSVIAMLRQPPGETNHEPHKCTPQNKLLHDQGELRRVNQIGGPRTEGAHHRQIVGADRRRAAAASHPVASAAGRQGHQREKHTREDSPVKQPTMPLTRPPTQQPYSAASFLELSYPTTNGDPFTIWAMLDDGRRRGWRRGFGIDPALDVTTVALKEVDANYAVHCRPGDGDADQATVAPR
jgi:hypothetical protein